MISFSSEIFPIVEGGGYLSFFPPGSCRRLFFLSSFLLMGALDGRLPFFPFSVSGAAKNRYVASPSLFPRFSPSPDAQGRYSFFLFSLDRREHGSAAAFFFSYFFPLLSSTSSKSIGSPPFFDSADGRPPLFPR